MAFITGKPFKSGITNGKPSRRLFISTFKSSRDLISKTVDVSFALFEVEVMRFSEFFS